VVGVDVGEGDVGRERAVVLGASGAASVVLVVAAVVGVVEVEDEDVVDGRVTVAPSTSASEVDAGTVETSELPGSSAPSSEMPIAAADAATTTHNQAPSRRRAPSPVRRTWRTASP
jgi:hypothetical protein